MVLLSYGLLSSFYYAASFYCFHTRPQSFHLKAKLTIYDYIQ